MLSDRQFQRGGSEEGKRGCNLWSPTQLAGKEVVVVGESPVWWPLHWLGKGYLCCQDLGCALCEARVRQFFKGWAAVSTPRGTGLLAAPAEMLCSPLFQEPGNVVQWCPRKPGRPFEVFGVGKRAVGAPVRIPVVRRAVFGVMTGEWLPADAFAEHLLGWKPAQDLAQEMAVAAVSDAQ